jgi:4-hydroxy-tetrahydrodipicolinate synthase
LSGDDDLGFATLLSGAPGGIWTTPNLAPGLCVQLYEACRAGDVPRALGHHRALRDLMNSFFLTNHPGPLKEVMQLAGVGVGAARPPLRPMAHADRERAKLAFEKFVHDNHTDSFASLT